MADERKQGSGVRGQGSGHRGQGSGVRGQERPVPLTPDPSPLTPGAKRLTPDPWPLTPGAKRLASTACTGFLLGLLLAVGARELGLRALPPFRSPHLLLGAGLFGAAVAVIAPRGLARGLGWLLSVLIGGGLLLASYSALVAATVRAWALPPAPLVPTEAVVALSADIHSDGTLDHYAQFRLLHAYELLRQGWARRLVLTRSAPPRPSALPAVRRQMQALGLAYPVEEVGPVENTHDEALAVARLARARGWPRVILVSDPLHLRRAGMTFARAGLPVLASPGATGEYSLQALDNPGDQLAAFRDWLREAIGTWTYRRRGWL